MRNLKKTHLVHHWQGTSRFLAQGGADAPPLGFAKGGHFEVKDGHPDFLQIT